MPLQCGTWKKRLRARTGPICTGSKSTSNREGRSVTRGERIARMTRIATDVVVDVPMSELEADPYPRSAQMRRATPICWVPETGRLWITTWDLCDAAGDNHGV